MCIDAESERETSLWIKVHEQNATSQFSQSGAKTDSRCRLAHSTFLIKDRDDLCLAVFLDRCRDGEVLRSSAEEGGSGDYIILKCRFSVQASNLFLNWSDSIPDIRVDATKPSKVRAWIFSKVARQRVKKPQPSLPLGLPLGLLTMEHLASTSIILMVLLIYSFS
jgi:hypothetical protein